RSRRGRARDPRAHGLRRGRGTASARGARGTRRGGQSRSRRELDTDAVQSAMLLARSVHPLPGEAERKARLLALVDAFSSRRVHAARQQVVRIDRESGWPLSPAISGALARQIAPALDGCDAVILSDYGSGLVTPALADAVRRGLARRTRRRPVPVLLDSRYRL